MLPLFTTPVADSSGPMVAADLGSINIAHMIPYTGRAQGGPVFSLASLAADQIARNCRVTIFSPAMPRDGQPINFEKGIKVIRRPASSFLGYRRAPDLRRDVEKWLNESSDDHHIIHSHSLWTGVNRLAAETARTHRIPHVLSPCGTLDTAALHYKGWKKGPARWWFQDKALRQADCLHAKSEKEFKDIRAFGLKSPVVIIPNAVQAPPEFGVPPAEQFRGQFNLPTDRHILLYTGRIHPVKGLTRLIEAWKALGTARKDWMVVIAGPDEAGHLAELKKRLRNSNLERDFYFIGGVDDIWKWSACRAAELFVMPSDFENFGTAIAEAMLAGLPVITTMGTPWKILREQEAGWWVPVDAESLTVALRGAMALPEARRKAMGLNGRAIAQKYRSDRSVGELLRVYRWLMFGSTQPNFVRLD